MRKTANIFNGLLGLTFMLWVACDGGDGVGLNENGDLVAGPSMESVTLGASKDNTLYETGAGNLSNGSGAHFFAGRTANGFLRRGLMAFDVAGSIPSGATITSVTLTLHMSREASTSGAEVFDLHRPVADWGEGASVAPGMEGSGTTPMAGDATWLHTFFNTDFWATAGGDFTPTVSGSQTVDAVGFYSWSGPAMVADVQAWLDVPATNVGWMLIGGESTDFSAKRFDSRENADVSKQPELAVEYTVP